MRYAAALLLIPFCALAACSRSGLYADRSIPIVAPAASAEAAPRFVGRWAASASQCPDALVIQPRSLKAADSDCDFAKVDANSAGYTVAAVCRNKTGPNPVRLTIVTPDQARISMLTIAGGPFKDGVPLERCPAV